MSTTAESVTFLIVVLILTVLCAGTPDLLDAIIHRIERGTCEVKP